MLLNLLYKSSYLPALFSYVSKLKVMRKPLKMLQLTRLPMVAYIYIGIGIGNLSPIPKLWRSKNGR
jgi:hypothetical protein